MTSTTFPSSVCDSYGELGWESINLTLEVSSFKPWHTLVLVGVSNSSMRLGKTLSGVPTLLRNL